MKIDMIERQCEIIGDNFKKSSKGGPHEAEDECECENLGSQCHSCEGDENDNEY